MPSTYTVNLGIEKPATGEQSGTWGDTTNVNFDIIDQAVNGSERVTLTSAGTSGSPNDLNIVNGSTTSSEGRNKWLEIYSASDLGGSAYVRLVPNDAEKILFIRNSLAGSQSVLLFQGTYNASNDLEIPAGVDMVVKFDGAGASATVTDVFTKLRATEITTPTLTAGTADINGGSVDGATVGAASASTGAFTTLTASTSLNIAASTTVDGVLDEDNMASDSATKLATQQSIKAYVDSQVGTVDTLAEILANGNTSGANNLIIDSGQALTSNTINETTAGSGVTIDSVLLKDDGVNATNLEITNIKANDGTAAATIANSTGNFTITNFISNSVDIGGGAIDGTVIGGATAAAITGTTITGTSFVSSGDMTFGDDDKAIFGAGSDLQIYHTGADSRLVDSGTGTFYIAGTDIVFLDGTLAERYADFTFGGAARLFYDNAEKLSTTTTGIDVTGAVTAYSLTTDDDVAGTSTLGRYSSGFAYSLVRPSATATGIEIRTNAGDALAHFLNDGTTKLHHSGSAKLTTLSTGIDVTGTATMDGLTVDGSLGSFAVQSSGAEVHFSRNENNDILANGGTSASFTIGANNNLTFKTGATLTQRLQIASNGDITFFDTDGSTASFVYDASAGLTINEAGADRDFRVESDANTHMLFVDGGNNRVGVAQSAPQEPLHATGRILSTTTYGSSTQRIGTSIGQNGNTRADIDFRRWTGASTNHGVGMIEVADTGIMRFYVDSVTSNTPATTERISLDPTGAFTTTPAAGGHAVFNENSVDADFRVESDTNTHMLFVDAGTSRIGIGEPAPAYKLDILGASGDQLRLNNGGERFTQMYWQTNGSNKGAIWADDTDSSFAFYAYAGIDADFYSNAQKKLSLRSASVVVNEDSADIDFRVESDTNTHALFVDAGNNVIGTGTASPATYVGTGGLAVKGSTVSDLSLVSGGIASGNNSHQMRYWNDTGTAYEIARTRVNVGDGQVNRGEYQFAVNNGGGLRQWLDVDYQGNVRFNEGGNESDFRVESDGNANMLFVDGGNNRVGIGTSAPTTFLDVGGIGSSVNSSFNGIAITASAAFTGVTGNVGLYLSASNSGGSLNGFFRTKAGAGGTYDGVEIATDNRPFRILTSTTEDTDERLRLTNTGNLLVGTTSSDARLHVGSNLTSLQAFRAFGNTAGDLSNTCGQFGKYDNNTTTSQVFVNFTINNGGIAQGQINANGSGAVAFGSWSDRRLKENITDLPSQLANITALRPVEFDYIESEGGGHQLGFIAQEVEEIYPDLVGERQDGMKTLSGMGKMEARLIKAIQEQQTLIETLEARIAALES
jgi:hypothetical protein